jgi:hypothetical protein
MTMRSMLIALATGCVLISTSAVAQLKTFPELEGRIPAPLPPPPQPPIINGFNGRQGPPPGVAETKPLNTFGDRVSRCMHEGAANGLHGGRLSRYVRRCGNSG